ncbi:PAS-domain containing protein [Bradyrhizobium sp. ARR65]|uniref:PAS-domain containing protein n=1 Tax=Bradyrhizobium sp. ARR65 TaxID=1040989 RepID=UPI000465206D|nr:PAS-domain containing protein [Bradyrhizobium sp. ARR65]
MQFDWRSIYGPVLAAATALTAISIDRYLIGVPNPAPLYVCIVALAGSLSGLRSAMPSAAIAIIGSALLVFSRDADFDGAELLRLAMLSVTACGTAAITGLLRQQLLDTFAQERMEHVTAQRLAAALDQIDIGIVLLDADTRAGFINRAFRFYFSLPDAKANSKPPFIALMYHGRDTGAFELPEEQLNAYIARRMEMMRAGDSTPIIIRLKDGTALRFSCTALAGGGRMLSYTPVTDLIRHTDDPADGEYHRSLRVSDEFGLVRQLRAAE